MDERVQFQNTISSLEGENENLSTVASKNKEEIKKLTNLFLDLKSNLENLQVNLNNEK
jgi:hypothetical protein